MLFMRTYNLNFYKKYKAIKSKLNFYKLLGNQIHLNMIFPFIVLICATYCTRERRSISNIEHVLSRVFNMIDDRCQQKKRKRSKYYDQTESVFCIIHGGQQCNS